MSRPLLAHIALPLPALLAAALSLWSPLARAEAALLDRVLAVAGEEVVLLSEFDQRYAALRARFRKEGRTLPPAQELRRQLLDQMVLERLQLQRGERASIQISDREVTAALQRVAADKGLNLDGMVDQLEREGEDYAAMRQQLREQMIIERVQLGHVRRRAQLTPQEVQAYLDSPAGAALLEPRYHLAHVRMPLATEASAEREVAARKRLARLRRRAAHSDLLRAAESDATLRASDLQWRTRGELPYLFEEIVAEMAPGEIAGPLRNDSGLHLVQLVGRRGLGETVVEVRARHILLQPSELRNADETRAELEQLRHRLLAGEDFAVLAREHSDDYRSRLDGGELGWLQARRVVPRFAAAMLDLEVGELSGVVESSHGFHLIEALERRRRDAAEEEARRRAADILYRQRYPEELQAWLNELRDSSYVEIRW